MLYTVAFILYSVHFAYSVHFRNGHFALIKFRSVYCLGHVHQL